MTRRMTLEEAIAMIETVFETEPECIATGLVEVTVWNTDAGMARADLDSFFAITPGDIDQTTIQVIPDRCDEDDSPAARIIVRTEG